MAESTGKSEGAACTFFSHFKIVGLVFFMFQSWILNSLKVRILNERQREPLTFYLSGWYIRKAKSCGENFECKVFLYIKKKVKLSCITVLVLDHR